jgi:peptidoglycan/LPS O-acetylase OafA/YrhL
VTATVEPVLEVSSEPVSRAPFERKLLQDVAGDRSNNFDLLRLIAAFLVMVDHTFPLAGEPHLGAATLGFSLGQLAVSAFFVMSGFLIAKSWLDDPSPVRFVVKRALRLMPALLVVTAFCALFIGPLVTDLSVRDYLAHPLTHDYIKSNSAVFPIIYSLPGVFTDNPYPNAVNGSLWSLPVEVLAYGVVLALGVAGLLRRRGAIVAVLAVTVYMDWHLTAKGWLGGGVWFYMPTVQIWNLLTLFLVGTLFYLYRDKIWLSGPVAAALVGLVALSAGTPYQPLAFLFCVPYLLFVVGYASLPQLRWITRPGDVSYGIYIFAFPIQQSIMNAWPDLGPWAALAVATPLTYAVAFASWRLIERPSLRFKRLVGPRKGPIVSAAPMRPGEA